MRYCIDAEVQRRHHLSMCALSVTDNSPYHYGDVIMAVMASQITSLIIVYSKVYWGAKKTSKLLVTGLCAGNSPETGAFPAQMASNTENVSIWWRHHDSSPRWVWHWMSFMKSSLIWVLITRSWHGSIFCVAALCEENPPVTGGFSWQRATNMACFLWCTPEQTVEG